MYASANPLWCFTLPGRPSPSPSSTIEPTDSRTFCAVQASRSATPSRSSWRTTSMCTLRCGRHGEAGCTTHWSTRICLDPRSPTSSATVGPRPLSLRMPCEASANTYLAYPRFALMADDDLDGLAALPRMRCRRAVHTVRGRVSRAASAVFGRQHRAPEGYSPALESRGRQVDHAGIRSARCDRRNPYT